jgi:acyl-CoA synthetase (AMP-forming)/AMP-acid ligase II
MSFPHTIGRMLELAASAVPNQLSVTLGEESLTFAESELRAQRMAEALSGLGLQSGDRLMYWGPISLRELDVFSGTQKLGVAFAPFKDSLSLGEAQPLVEYVRPALLVVDARIQEQGAELAARAGVRLATIGGGSVGADLDAAFETATGGGPAAEVDDENIHALFLTSGSTGRPKGAMVSHRASWNRSYNGMTRTPVCGGGELNTFPLFHWAGWNYLLVPWAHLRSCHLTHRADSTTLNSLIERWGPRAMYAVPAVWERILDGQATPGDGELRLACTGTYRYDPLLIERIQNRFPNAACSTGWGATELGMGAMIDSTEQRRKPHSVGLPAPGVEVRIVDGELMARSDQMMSGYFEMPDETSKTVVDGWYRTGDLAERDEDGYITISGRKREVIRSGAETIAPAEVEAVLLDLPGVADACVVGVPDLEWGEIVCAVLVPVPGSALPTVEELRTNLSGRLARFKHPRRVVELEELPRTPATGQIRRGEVREWVTTSGVAQVQ